MKLSPEEKAARARQKTLDQWKAFSIQTCRTKTAREFQKMTRAEAAAQPNGYTNAMDHGMLVMVYRHVGECVCVTCGKVLPWNTKGMHTGHWIGRVHQSTLMEPDNVAPQCYTCNEPLRGNVREYTMWMEHVRGREVIERLQAIKRQPVSFTREDLVDRRIDYSRRLKAAIAKMKG